MVQFTQFIKSNLSNVRPGQDKANGRSMRGNGLHHPAADFGPQAVPQHRQPDRPRDHDDDRRHQHHRRKAEHLCFRRREIVRQHPLLLPQERVQGRRGAGCF